MKFNECTFDIGPDASSMGLDTLASIRGPQWGWQMQGCDSQEVERGEARGRCRGHTVGEKREKTHTVQKTTEATETNKMADKEKKNGHRSEKVVGKRFLQHISYGSHRNGTQAARLGALFEECAKEIRWVWENGGAARKTLHCPTFAGNKAPTCDDALFAGGQSHRERQHPHRQPHLIQRGFCFNTK